MDISRDLFARNLNEGFAVFTLPIEDTLLGYILITDMYH